MKRIKEKENTRICASVRPRENDNHDDNDDEELQNRTYKKGSLSPTTLRDNGSAIINYFKAYDQ
jgi:hypothetical protein